jgi:N-acetylglucosaminyldiphosphoundecaprenol N-acetyl-beta-D-mannosaminyltransferase
MNAPVVVWGLPFAPLTLAGTVDAIEELVEAGKPSYFITANTHYAMLSSQVPRLAEVNARAALVLADGKPPVWASRLLGTPLPERVAGSDLIYGLAERAAARGHRLFLLGGAEGVADEAARRLSERYPGLVIAGTACPPHRPMDDDERRELIDRVRAAKPHILLVAFGQPKGEFWIAENLEALGVPVSAQVGATLDFVAGRVRRAPAIVQKIGMEWAFRMALEPRRLAPRYARNARFLAARLARDLAAALRRPSPPADRADEPREAFSPRAGRAES